MEGSVEKFEKPISNREINEASELELSDALGAEKEKADERYQVEIQIERALEIMEFIDKEYFKNFLDKLDAVDSSIIEKASGLLGIDIEKMREYIDNKIPMLLEDINTGVKENNMNLIQGNSFRDVIGNSIVAVFKMIVFVVENFESDDSRVRNKIDNPNSVTRKIIKNYSKGEGENGIASYYIDSLCEDNNKLRMELGGIHGYLARFSEYFYNMNSKSSNNKVYPTGAKKLPYFRFFSELEKGNIKKEKIRYRDLGLEEELAKLDGDLFNKDKIRKNFLDKKK